MSFLVNSLKLNALLGDMVNCFHADNLADEDDDVLGQHQAHVKMTSSTPLMRQIEAGDLRSLVKYETSLTAWEMALPQILRTPSVAELQQHDNLAHSQSSDRQAVVLRARCVSAIPQSCGRLTCLKLPDICTASSLHSDHCSLTKWRFRGTGVRVAAANRRSARS